MTMPADDLPRPSEPTAAGADDEPTPAVTDPPPSPAADPSGSGEERPMLLSRMAEAVYWTGRYLERAEATARIVSAHTELFLDLPKSAGLGWESLLVVTGSEDPFEDRHPVPTEEAVVAFLAIDRANPGSIISALGRARDNVRTARAIFPREAWETVNALYLVSLETAEEAVVRHGRVAWTGEVIREVQRLGGLLADAMSHDDAYSFFRMGRLLERADMTTRVLDVRVAGLLDPHADRLAPYAEVQWLSMLRSLTADQMYRRKVHGTVAGPESLRFLLRDPQFPRSVEHCLTDFAGALLEVPRHEEPMAACARAQRFIETPTIDDLTWEHLHGVVDAVQQHLAELHDAVRATYFDTATPVTAGLLATA